MQPYEMFVAKLLVAVLNVASVCSLKAVPFRVREVSLESIGVGINHRIYGGSEASNGQFPYMIFALIKYPDQKLSQCSASLLSPNWVLLAAHCIYVPNLKPQDIILVGGEVHLMPYIKERLKMNYYVSIDEQKFGVQERRAKEFFYHPNYNDETIEHDVALIKVDKPFHLGSIKTISLSLDEIKSPKLCTILGWGLTRGNVQNYKLNFVENRIVSTTKLRGCRYKPLGQFICLQPDNSGICQGDSGSPLVCDDKVWGVASHFVSDREHPDCGDSFEEYYTEFYADREWINSVYSSGNLSAVINLMSVLVCAFAAVWLSLKI